MEIMTILMVYIVLVIFLIWVCVVSDPNSDSLVTQSIVAAYLSTSETHPPPPSFPTYMNYSIPTPGGKLNILLTEDLPGLLTRKLRRCLPSSLFDSLARTYDYVVNQRNPLLQLLYLLLYLGSFATFIYEGWGRMETIDLILSTTLVVACLCSFVAACSVPAGTITPTSWPTFDNYKADEIIYASGKECMTCKVPKLARSKHCRLCGVCQSRFDHHCGWLNQCVGELNYRHFLFFLALHSMTFFWGSSRLWGVLRREMAEKQLWEAKFYSPSSGTTVGATPVVVLQYLVVHEGAVCGVLALCFVMAVVLAGFLLYHLRLAWRNTTTNETFKWSAVRAHAKLARDHARRAHEASGGALPLRQIADPPNSYHISFVDNLKEVFFPRCERPGAAAGRRAGGTEAAGRAPKPETNDLTSSPSLIKKDD